MTAAYAPAPVRRIKPISIVVGALLASTAVLTVAGLMMVGARGPSALTHASFQSGASWPAVRHAIWQNLLVSTLAPWYWAFVAFLTACQWIWPAQRDQRNNFSVEMAVDAVWFVMGNAMQFTVVAIVLGAVTVAYTEFLGTWSLNLEPHLGLWGLAVFAYVLTDAFAWVSHWCHHKVSTLWRFHLVHHSQQRLNALSDNRTHVGEVILAALIVFVPSQLLGLNASVSMRLAFLGIYYSAMLHSNIRTNLGPLRYIFMGPQPHRVHHSVESKYFEHNFGTTFPWWDFMAGTYYRGVNEYPPTGVSDKTFPLRQRGDLNPVRWVTLFFRQLGHPFKGIYLSWLYQPALHSQRVEANVLMGESTSQIKAELSLIQSSR
jgi:sterol desaturase/sphingolipid hydroxylase (fatty acid hydroxylase superfamily)